MKGKRLVRKVKRGSFWTVWLIWGWAELCHGADPVVSNVRAEQREGSKLVDIYYNVADADGDRQTVSVQVKVAGVPISASSFSAGTPPGYGGNVTPGINRHIVWDAGADWDGRFFDEVVIVVTANDGTTLPPPPGPGMVFIPAASFSMGDSFGEGWSEELPVHAVYVSGFYMDRYEVTNDEMVRVLNWAYGQGKLRVSASSVRNDEGSSQELMDLDDPDCRISWNGSRFEMKTVKGSGYPCVEVTWYGAVAYCNYRTQMEGGGRTPCYDLNSWSCNWSASGYRLPTEAEWEKAARGGLSGQRFPWGDTIQHSRGNYYSRSSYSYDTSPTRGYHPDYYDGGYPYTSPVGAFVPNGYGLYNMAGNMFEWCWDWYSSGYYGVSPATDPRGPASGSYRVFRGGSWYSFAAYCRVVYRDYFYPVLSYDIIGFRAVLPPGQP